MASGSKHERALRGALFEVAPLAEDENAFLIVTPSGIRLVLQKEGCHPRAEGLRLG